MESKLDEIRLKIRESGCELTIFFFIVIQSELRERKNSKNHQTSTKHRRFHD